MSAVALELGNARNIGTGALIAIVVVGIILALFITSLIGRIVILVVVIALGTYVWQQRTSIEHKLSAKKCQLNATFFGVHVKAPPDVVSACLKQTQGK
jgi:fumarate reductase subunit D